MICNGYTKKLWAPVMGAVTGLGGEMQIVGVDPPNGESVFGIRALKS